MGENDDIGKMIFLYNLNEIQNPLGLGCKNWNDWKTSGKES